MNRLIKNNKGFSLAEIMVAVGLMGVIGLGVSGLIKQTNTLKRESQSDNSIDLAFKEIQSYITYSENNNNCEAALAGTLNNSSISAGKYFAGKAIDPTTTIQSISSSPAGGSVSGKTRVAITVTFVQKMTNGQTKTVTKIFVRPVVLSGGSLTCKEFDENEVESEAVSKVCTEVGGTLNGNSCDMDPTTMDPDLQERIKRFACSLFGDISNYSGGICSSIDVTNAAYGDNITPAQVCINGTDCRQNFESSSCSSGEFLTGVSTEGYKNCSDVNFVGQGNVCIPSCACAYATTVGETCPDNCGGECNGKVPACTASNNCSCANSTNANLSCTGDDGCGNNVSCQGKKCDYLDSYSVSGSNCNFKDYATLTSTPGSCSAFSNSTLTTPTCKQIRSGTCSGSTGPTYENVANGTPCGGGNTCQSGNCVDPYPCSAPNTQTWSSCTGFLLDYNDTTGVAYYESTGTYIGNANFQCQANGSFVLNSGSTCNGGGGGGSTGGGGGGGSGTSAKKVSK